MGVCRGQSLGTVIFFRDQQENHCVTEQSVGMSLLPWITRFLVRGHAYTYCGVSFEPRVFAGILQYFFVCRRDRRPLEVCVYSVIVLLSCLYSFEAHREWDPTQGQEQSPWFVLSDQRESTLVHLFTSGVSGERYKKRKTVERLTSRFTLKTHTEPKGHGYFET